LEAEPLTDNLNDIGPLPDLPRKKGRKKRTMSAAEREQKTSPEWNEHLKQIGFQKGRAKTGGRVATPKETKEWIASKAQDVAELLYDMAFDEEIAPKERMKAAMWVAEMSMSKAPTETNVQVNHSVSIAEMLTQINQARVAASNSTTHELIDITPTPDIVEAVAEPIIVEAEPVNANPKLRIAPTSADE
jgi:hypothetical protein